MSVPHVARPTRPLYNLPAIAKAREVVLVEGEKCAAALVACGIAATTAMNGAKAPVDKDRLASDWPGNPWSSGRIGMPLAGTTPTQQRALA